MQSRLVEPWPALRHSAPRPFTTDPVRCTPLHRAFLHPTRDTKVSGPGVATFGPPCARLPAPPDAAQSSSPSSSISDVYDPPGARARTASALSATQPEAPLSKIAFAPGLCRPLPASPVPCLPRACACACARAYLHMCDCARLLARAWREHRALSAFAVWAPPAIAPNSICQRLNLFLPNFAK